MEVSKDGKAWMQVVDHSKNTTASTPAGDRFEFKPTHARHMPVNMLYHNLNTGVHIVEVEAIENRE